MRATFNALAILLSAFAMTVQPQPSPPTQGIQLASTDDVRFPLTISQCEPVFIYYNVDTPGYSLVISTIVDDINAIIYLLRLNIPLGSGYLEWICNIPAGYSFLVEGSYTYIFVVQPGSSSSCLRDITTTYAYASYATTFFRSFTANPPTPLVYTFDHATYIRSSRLSLCPRLTLLLARLFPSPLILDPSQRSLSSTRPNLLVRTYLSSPFNSPELAISSTTKSLALSSTSTTQTTIPTPIPPNSRKSKTPAIVGGIFGAIVVAAISTAIFVWIRGRRQSQQHVADYPIPTSETIIYNTQSGPIAQEQAPVVPSASSKSTPFPSRHWEFSIHPQIHGCPRLLGIIVCVHLSRIVRYSNLILLDPESPMSSYMGYSPDSPGASSATPIMSSTVALPPSYLQSHQAQTLGDSGFPPPGMQPSFAPKAGSEPDPPDVMTALNVITRMDPSQQRTLISVLNTLVPSERAPPGLPNSVVRAPYSS